MSLGEIIELLIEQRLCDVHTSLPGKVVAFDAANHTADVQPLLKRTTFDEYQNRTAPESYPLLPDIPVKYPCGGGYTITFPLNVGDMGMIEVCEGGLEEVCLTGDESEPFDLRRHHLSNATFVPNFWDRTDLMPIVANALVIGRRASGQQIRISESAVDVCNAAVGSSTGFVASATLVSAVFSSISTLLSAWITAHSSSPTAPLLASDLLTLFGNIVTALASSVASTNLKAD